MKHSQWILLLVGIILGWLLHRPDTVVSTITNTDTLLILQPKLDTITITEKEIVPIMVQFPSDTIRDTAYLDLEVDIQRRVYQDSLYRAVVRGAVIGDIYPTLEELSIRHKHTYETIRYKPKLFTPYGSVSVGSDIFTLGGGIMIRQKYGLGVDLTNIQGQNYIALRGILTF